MPKPKTLLLAGICALALAGTPDAKPRVRFGGVVVGAGYGYYRGFPYFSPFYYDRYFYGFAPLYPGYFTGFAFAPNLGEVKLRTSAKDGEVFLNGAYAGEAAKLKSMWLDPGAYDLEVRSAGHAVYGRRIYVLTGKTLRIRSER
jgi:PEGA domain